MCIIQSVASHATALKSMQQIIENTSNDISVKSYQHPVKNKHTQAQVHWFMFSWSPNLNNFLLLRPIKNSKDSHYQKSKIDNTYIYKIIPLQIKCLSWRRQVTKREEVFVVVSCVTNIKLNVYSLVNRWASAVVTGEYAYPLCFCCQQPPYLLLKHKIDGLFFETCHDLTRSPLR